MITNTGVVLIELSGVLYGSDLEEGFSLDGMMRYSHFVPRLYNYCLSLGFKSGQIIPSRAFCSDENQGFPIILLAKHFGSFPFNHGRVGGVVATDRHGPHAHHGQDMVIIHASHVGYDPEKGVFGQYCRLQTTDHKKTTTCGKIGGVIQPYLEDYRFAQKHILLGRMDDVKTITIDNQLLNDTRVEGLFPDLVRMISQNQGSPDLLRKLSSSKVFVLSEELASTMPSDTFQEGRLVEISKYLTADFFCFKKSFSGQIEDHDHVENNLFEAMPDIVTSSSPLLRAAQVNTQVEFDRAFRSMAQEKEYRHKKLLFISCLNIDISPKEGQLFPLTKCIPWAASMQDELGNSKVFEQEEIISELQKQSHENPHQIDLEKAIQCMIKAPEVKIDLHNIQ